MSEYTGTRPASDYRAQRRERKKIIAKTQRKLARIREKVARETKPQSQDEGTKA